ncbi:hypothetical protein H9Q08_17695 [Chryseobacterium sp. PS-8]|jgi:uncharacterized membrane protein|uniref:DUF4013 domain-containing protein n=1 Tax=Chryseobacterium indicum TaxID=2766954 RepID=A0ABS9C9X8_9FLAO|nr:hypothetical protein [Chryseobacterium sp. PS-8]MCF2221123.1 hypothetical protein [Chryseobacterium sp. PS-8]
MVKINAKPVNFKLGNYISDGYEFYKANFGNLLGAFFLAMVMSIIPFCGLLAVGNFYKYCRDLRAGRQVSAGDIFNFDNFTPYFMIQLILFAGVMVIYIPMIIMMVAMGEQDPSAGPPAFFFIYMFFVYVGILFVALKGFYMPALISLAGVTEIKQAWKISSVMSKGNLWSIFLYSLAVAFLSQLGVIACFIGLIFTIPFAYASHYFAYEDALKQVTYDEIQEIGIKNEF